MELNKLQYKKGSRGHKVKVAGRGFGNGGTSGFRGQTLAHKSRLAFEGNQTALYQRVRKIGFNNYEFANNYNVITLKQLNTLNESQVDMNTLVAHRIFKNNDLPLKVIGNDKVTLAIDLKVNKITDAAKKAIEAAGGSVEILN
ncbi:MAG: 50S ribosomal protein L15 [Mycoplasmataceae bacterium]|jgi:large subunit ribosomal protein L15|nr:50S ribosomal protein L15 [Mycoplasmataceae bacterium]